MTTTSAESPSTPLLVKPKKKAWRWRGGLEAAAASLVGLNHSKNEDSYRYLTSSDAPDFCAVADGVGGGACGDIASKVLIEHCAKATPQIARDPASLVAWLQVSDMVVRGEVAQHSTEAGASTLVAAWFLSTNLCHVVNIGDCRAYLLRPKRGTYSIKQVTIDQTYAALGLQPPTGGSEDDPACMAGVGAVGVPPVVKVKLKEHDILLLCSDGLHKFIEDNKISEILCEKISKKQSLESLCQELVKKAKENKSHDDITVVLVKRHPWFGVDQVSWFSLLVAFGLALVSRYEPLLTFIHKAMHFIGIWLESLIW